MTTPAMKSAPEKGDKNLVQVFLQTVARSPDAAAARYKRGGSWVSMSWREMEKQARARAAGLIGLGVQQGDRVAVIGNSTLDWVLCELAVHMAGAVSVPIYQTNVGHEVKYVLENSEAIMAFAEDDLQVAKFKELQSEIPAIRQVIRMEGKGEGDWIMDLDALVEQGKGHEDEIDGRVAATSADDPACFIYTSGTTGLPKGVMLMHSNWSYEGAALEILNIVKPEDEELLFLPLAHSFAQVLKATWFALGHVMAFAESVEKLVENIGEVRPTIMASVPRIFEKVYSRVVSQGMEAGGVKGRLFGWTMSEFEKYAEARKQGREEIGLQLAIGKKLVFSKVAARLNELFGGRLRFFISGGAPLSPKIAYFFDLAEVKILEGYGLTETSAATCVNLPERNKIGTVGPPLPGTIIKIAEDGEILIKGGGVMQGYYKLPDATREVLGDDGFFHTGDIGELDADNYLRITDRKKDIIVTAGGKNVAPQNIENQLKTHPIISQVVVHGDKRKFLSALITLDQPQAEKLAQEKGVSFSSLEDLTKKPVIREEIQKAIDALNAQLASYESIKKFAILPTDFSQETGELTPTLKVKRRVVEKTYADLLDSFYEGERY